MSLPFNSDRHAINWLKDHLPSVNETRSVTPDGKPYLMLYVQFAIGRLPEPVSELAGDAITMLKERGWNVDCQYGPPRKVRAGPSGLRGARGSIIYDEAPQSPPWHEPRQPIKLSDCGTQTNTIIHSTIASVGSGGADSVSVDYESSGVKTDVQTHQYVAGKSWIASEVLAAQRIDDDFRKAIDEAKAIYEAKQTAARDAWWKTMSSQHEEMAEAIYAAESSDSPDSS